MRRVIFPRQSLVVGLVALLIPLISYHLPTGNHTEGMTGNPILNPFIINRYSLISARYDSVVLRCEYGEICLSNYDSLVIDFMNWNDPPGIDTTASGIYALARTETFPVADTFNLSMWRSLFLSALEVSKPLFVPDTIAWTAELFNAATNGRVALLDSVGFVRQRMADSASFPDAFGVANESGNSYDLLNFTLGNFTQSGVDSAYLRFKIIVFGYQNYPYCHKEEMDYGWYKFSDDFAGAPKRIKRKPNPDNVPWRLVLFPNPVSAASRIMVVLGEPQYLRLGLYARDGKLIQIISEREFTRGTTVIPFNAGQLPSGAYYIRITDTINRQSSTVHFIHVK